MKFCIVALFLISTQASAHEMMLACVSSKRECITKARASGYTPLRTVKDQARCPGRGKLACIVFH